MGICESRNHGKTLSSEICQKKPSDIVDRNDQTFDYRNIAQEESGNRPSIFNKSDIKNSQIQNIKNDNKPELAQYNRSILCSGKRLEESFNNNKTSVFSSGVSEEEIIIQGEINKEAKNKEEDFVNASFKKLVQNKGGIIITNKDEKNTNINESRKQSSLFDLGKENISEIKSTVSIPMQNSGIKGSNVIRNSSDFGLSSIKYDNSNDNSKNVIISGKYDNNGNLIPNNKIPFNGIYNKGKNNVNNNLIGINNNISKNNNNNNRINNIMKGSNRINISLHESCPRIDSYLNVPKNDQPPPDIEELSENMLQNSTTSGK